jgi:hypothetical protein
MNFKTTEYFETRVAHRHPEIMTYRCYIEKALTDAVHEEDDVKGRTRLYIYVPEEDKYLRVIVLADGETIHNAFFDSHFRRRMNK